VAASLARVPVVVSTGYFTAHWRRPRLVEPVGQLAFRLIDAFVTDAHTTIEEFDRWRWSKRARLVMIPNGVPPALPTLPAATVRARLGLPSGDEVRVVGVVCRMIEGKGYETFLRALQLVRQEEPGVVGLCCGYAEDPDYRASLVALAEELGLSGSVVFTSWPGAVGDPMSVLDVYARVSLEDSSPIGVHEAMSAGVPIVLTDVGGARELVEHERTGLLVPPEDPQAVAAAVLRLLRDRDLADRLVEQGHQEYEARFTPEVMARAHEELFVELLAGRRHGTRRRAPRQPGAVAASRSGSGSSS
jgi:glycosyltransferase involved in cell wall biosynthesis